MSPCGYGLGVSPCLQVDMDMEYPKVSMWIQTWSVSMFHVDMDMECLHVDPDMECLHVSMWIWTWSASMS